MIALYLLKETKNVKTMWKVKIVLLLLICFTVISQNSNKFSLLCFRQIVLAQSAELMLQKCIGIQNDQPKSTNLIWVFLITCIYGLSIELNLCGFQPSLYQKGQWTFLCTV